MRPVEDDLMLHLTGNSWQCFAPSNTLGTLSKVVPSRLSPITSCSRTPLTAPPSGLHGRHATEQSPWQTRHLSFISEFTTTLQQVSGKHNVVADALSRIFSVDSSGVDFEQLSATQATSEEITAYKTAVTGLNLENILYGKSTVHRSPRRIAISIHKIRCN